MPLQSIGSWRFLTLVLLVRVLRAGERWEAEALTTHPGTLSLQLVDETHPPCDVAMPATPPSCKCHRVATQQHTSARTLSARTGRHDCDTCDATAWVRACAVTYHAAGRECIAQCQATWGGDIPHRISSGDAICPRRSSCIILSALHSRCGARYPHIHKHT